MRPARVAAGCRPAELLACDDSVVSLQPNPLAQVPVDREATDRVLEDDVVVEACTGLAVVAIELASCTEMTRPSSAAKTGTPMSISRKLRMSESVPVCPSYV